MVPGKTLRTTSALLIFLLITGCAAKRHKADPYFPTQELVKAKSDKKVVRLWNRWAEEDQHQYLVAGQIVQEPLGGHRALASLLADDPDPGVQEALASSKRWQTAGAISGLTGTVLLIFGIIGVSNGDDGEQNFSTNTNIALFSLTGLATIFAGACVRTSDSRLKYGLELHNRRIDGQGSRASASLKLEVSF